MTECEEKELIKSLAIGMGFDEISDIYGISKADVTAFCGAHKSEADEEMKFLKEKRGG